MGLVEETVDVTEPDEEREGERVNVAEAEGCVEVVADADGADDVDREERNPAQQEHSCARTRCEQIRQYKMCAGNIRCTDWS